MTDDKRRKAEPFTKTERFFKLAGMTATVAGGYAKDRLKAVFQDKAKSALDRASTHKSNGERIAETLGELKGAAMKIGQMASVAGDLLPKELSSALVSLQREAPPMSYEVIAAQIEKELGAPPEVLFHRFDREPFAAASIGQVHRAQVDDGREVVVKVQYPGVDTSVDSDLSHLKLALRASGIIKMDRKSFNALFREIRDRLHEELDYCNEADNVRLFREFHKDDDFILIPEVVGERSSKRVLTLTYVEGDNINDMEALGYAQEVRDTIGANIFRMVLKQIFGLQSIHADPNPANFAFRKDGTVVLYDFGCVKKLLPEIIEAYGDTCYAAFVEDYAAVESGMIRLGARTPDTEPIPPEYYKKWRDILLRPFITTEPFDYGTSTVHDEVKLMLPTFIAKLGLFQPPVEVIFMDRVIVGHYGNMRMIRSRGHFGDLVLPFVSPKSD